MQNNNVNSLRNIPEPTSDNGAFNVNADVTKLDLVQKRSTTRTTKINPESKDANRSGATTKSKV